MKKTIRRRLTRQRQMILEELQKVKTHPTGEALLKMVHRRLPSVSLGTLYRNLNLLRDQGDILELRCGRYSCHYDGDTRLHYHFFCLKCQSVFDIDETPLKGIDEKVGKKSGWDVKFHRLDFYGYCARCRQET